MRRALGKPVGVVHIHPTSGEEIVEPATLLSVEAGALVRVRDRVEAVDPARIVFFDVPADLRPRPTLMATLDAEAAGHQSIALGYLTQGLGWSADYVGLWDEASGQIELSGRATLSNSSGGDFPDASLALIAGSINRVSPPRPAPMARMQAAPMMAEAKAMPEREEFADLHLYRIADRVSLLDQQTKQVALMAPLHLSAAVHYVSEGGVTAYRQAGEPRVTHPEVRLRFENAGEGAVPLPAGIVRLYATAKDDTPRLLGEDRIDHTAVGAPVTLTPGTAFDLSVERRQTDFSRSGLPDTVSESAWSIEAKNARDKPAVIDVVEIVPGDWTVLAESAKHEQSTSDRLTWHLIVPPKGAATLTYRVRIQQ
ncbi:MAG: DUF4139 domain-containing protein [Rhodospirillales bacterium]|nr:DUF4139 domain-containing protein [Rhodospirillales bacterium]